MWFSSYLLDTGQRVVLNGIFSEGMAALEGVPQGSILGSLLFLVFINDIIKCIGASICLFADNTRLYIIVGLPDQAAIILNTDLKTISDWAKSWLVAFNASKTLSIIFSRNSNLVVHPYLFMHDTLINETTNHNIWVLFSLIISRSSLEKMYISYARPPFEYSVSVWDYCSWDTRNLYLQMTSV